MVAQTSGEKSTVKKLGGFFRSVKAEIKKVNWPNRKELTNYTIVVVATCGLMALVIWLLDLGIHQLLKFILG